MVNRYRKPPPDLIDGITRTGQRIAKLERTPRSVATTVDHGNWIFKDEETGNQIVKFGKTIQESKAGFAFWRGANERLVFWTGGVVNQFFALSDNLGNTIFGDDAASQQGIATPYLNIPVGMSFNNNTFSLLPFTVSATFESLWEASPPMTHPRLRMLALVSNSDGATTGEARITISGQQVGSVVSIPAGGTFLDQTVDVPDWGTAIGFLNEVSIKLELRRLSGTGKMIAVIYSLYGRQT